MQTERAFQNTVKDMCKRHRILFRKFSSPSRRGVADVLLIAPRGKVVFVELKSPKGSGVLSPLQKHEHKLLRERGVEVYVIESKADADALISALATE